MSIYDIPGIVKIALPSAATPKNIQAGFRSSGIWEFNRNIFTDEDFLCSSVTDRPLSVRDESVEDQNENEKESNKYEAVNKPSTSAINLVNDGEIAGPSSEVRNLIVDDSMTTDISNVSAVSLTEIRPLPKAGPRKGKRSARKCLKSAILTSTPVKEKIRAEQKARERRKQIEEEKNKKKLYEKAKQCIKKLHLRY